MAMYLPSSLLYSIIDQQGSYGNDIMDMLLSHKLTCQLVIAHTGSLPLLYQFPWIINMSACLPSSTLAPDLLMSPARYMQHTC